LTQAKIPTIDESAADYLRTLAGANSSAATITAYRTDLAQFVAFLHETNCAIAFVAEVIRVDVAEYLAHLAERDNSGTTRVCKLATTSLGVAASRLRRWQPHLTPQTGELLDELGSHLRFLFIGEKRGVDCVERDPLYAVGFISPVPGQHEEFLRQRCAEEGWIVGVDGDQYASTVECRKRVVGKARHHAGAKVAGGAELERDAIPGEPLDEPRIVYSAHAMPDSLHTEKIERVANGGVAGGFSGVGDGVESRRPGARKIFHERGGWIANLVPSQSQSYDTLIG
jgi:hypothetical protein